MPTPAKNSGLRDNHTRGTVADFLTGKIRDGSRLSVVSAYFTIYAYDALKEVLERIDRLDFLFGEPTFVNRLDPSKSEKKAFLLNADGLKLANSLQQRDCQAVRPIGSSARSISARSSSPISCTARCITRRRPASRTQFSEVPILRLRPRPGRRQQ